MPEGNRRSRHIERLRLLLLVLDVRRHRDPAGKEQKETGVWYRSQETDADQG